MSNLNDEYDELSNSLKISKFKYSVIDIKKVEKKTSGEGGNMEKYHYIQSVLKRANYPSIMDDYKRSEYDSEWGCVRGDSIPYFFQGMMNAREMNSYFPRPVMDEEPVRALSIFNLGIKEWSVYCSLEDQMNGFMTQRSSPNPNNNSRIFTQMQLALLYFYLEHSKETHLLRDDHQSNHNPVSLEDVTIQFGFTKKNSYKKQKQHSGDVDCEYRTSVPMYKEGEHNTRTANNRHENLIKVINFLKQFPVSKSLSHVMKDYTQFKKYCKLHRIRLSEDFN